MSIKFRFKFCLIIYSATLYATIWLTSLGRHHEADRFSWKIHWSKRPFLAWNTNDLPSKSANKLQNMIVGCNFLIHRLGSVLIYRWQDRDLCLKILLHRKTVAVFLEKRFYCTIMKLVTEFQLLKTVRYFYYGLTLANIMLKQPKIYLLEYFTYHHAQLQMLWSTNHLWKEISFNKSRRSLLQRRALHSTEKYRM